MVIAFVALVVIGPEKLPKVARTAGAFFGRLQRFVTQVKDEVNREARFAELQTLQQEVQSGLQQGYTEIEQSILPTAPPVNEVEEVAAVKKTRKPRQRKVTLAGEAPIPDQPHVEHAELPALDAAPQAELFAVPAVEQKKMRRPRKTVKKEDDSAASVEEKPLA